MQILFGIAPVSHDEIAVGGRESDGRAGTRIEIDEILLDTIGEDQPILWHERSDGERILRCDRTKPQPRLGRAAREWLAHGEVQAGSRPRHGLELIGHTMLGLVELVGDAGGTV